MLRKGVEPIARAVLDVLDLGVAVVDSSGRLVFANRLGKVLLRRALGDREWSPRRWLKRSAPPDSWSLRSPNSRRGALFINRETLGRRSGRQLYLFLLHAEVLRQKDADDALAHIAATEKEKAAFLLKRKGMKELAIGLALGISQKAVERRLGRLYRRTGATRYVEFEAQLRARALR